MKRVTGEYLADSIFRWPYDRTGLSFEDNVNVLCVDLNAKMNWVADWSVRHSIS